LDRVVLMPFFMRSHTLFFFFASRRRHTSFSRDWSSDVCSSDLGNERNQTYFSYSFSDASGVVPTNSLTRHSLNLRLTNKLSDKRSEERRVGKECRLWMTL